MIQVLRLLAIFKGLLIVWPLVVLTLWLAPGWSGVMAQYGLLTICSFILGFTLAFTPRTFGKRYQAASRSALTIAYIISGLTALALATFLIGQLIQCDDVLQWHDTHGTRFHPLHQVVCRHELALTWALAISSILITGLDAASIVVLFACPQCHGFGPTADKSS
jgi:hypothetical protein